MEAQRAEFGGVTPSLDPPHFVLCRWVTIGTAQMRWKPPIAIRRRMNGEVKAYDTSVGRVNKLMRGGGLPLKKQKNLRSPVAPHP